MGESYSEHIEAGVSDEIKKFVDEEVFGNREFLFFTRKGNEEKAYCTKCKKEFNSELLELSHNATGVCPKCGHETQAKSTRYGRKTLVNEACFYYFEKSVKDSKVLVCKGYYVKRTYDDYKRPHTEYELQAAYLFGNGYNKMFKNSWGGMGERCSIFDYNTGWLSKYMCYCSFESLKIASKGTQFQYINFDVFEGHYSLVKLISECEKYPWIEYLIKMGFEEVVTAKLTGNLFNCINYKGKNIFRILKIPKEKMRELNKSKVKSKTPKFLKLYQINIKDNSKLTPEEVEKIEDRYGIYLYDLLEVSKYSNLRKCTRYMDKQKKKYGKDEHGRNRSYLGTVITYKDYLEGCKKLEMDMKSEHVLFPKDVYKSHDNIVKQIRVAKNKELDKKIKSKLKKLNRYYFEYNGYFIRAAESSEELIEEGKRLDHCVATHYLKPYAEGKTVILLIRSIDKPDIPLVTVEVKNNSVKQAYGIHDTRPSKEVLEFIEEYKKTILNRSNKKSKKIA